MTGLRWLALLILGGLFTVGFLTGCASPGEVLSQVVVVTPFQRGEGSTAEPSPAWPGPPWPRWISDDCVIGGVDLYCLGEERDYEWLLRRLSLDPATAPAWSGPGLYEVWHEIPAPVAGSQP